MVKEQALDSTHYIQIQEQQTKQHGKEKANISSAKCLSFNFFILILLIVSGIKLYSCIMLPFMYTVGYIELSCPSQNTTCQSLLCPEGMIWNKDKCLPDSTFDIKCCISSSTSIISCSRSSCPKSLVSASVLPSAQQILCRKGYLWVPWRKKCFRKS